MYLEWSDKYKVGIEEIDKQHQSLFDVTNQLIEARKKKLDRNTVERFLIALVDYAEYHFASEEQYFKNHPNADIHRREHANFVHRIIEFNKKFIDKEVNLDSVILSFLVNWIKKHVLEMDQRFLSSLM